MLAKAVKIAASRCTVATDRIGLHKQMEHSSPQLTAKDIFAELFEEPSKLSPASFF